MRTTGTNLKTVLTLLMVLVLSLSTICACGKTENHSDDLKKAQDIGADAGANAGAKLRKIEVNDDNATDRETGHSLSLEDALNSYELQADIQSDDVDNTEDEENTTEDEEITAAWLIDNLKTLDYDYIEAKMNIVLKSSQGNMDITMNIQADNDWAYTEMNMQGQKVKAWMDSNNDKVYTNVNGDWTETATKTQDYTKMYTGLNSKMCKDLQLTETDSTYDVCCNIPAEVAKQLTGDTGLDYSNVDLSDITYKATYRFDKNTKELKSCRIDILVSEDMQKRENITIDDYYIDCEYTEYNTGKTLTPPSFN